MNRPSSLDELVAQALAAAEEGGREALDAFLALHPGHEGAIRRALETLEEVGLFGGTDGTEREDFPERLGEFRLLERLGAGGMGVVFRALQEPLGREVALKVIRPEQLFFRGARERFRREVETVARLQHPGIVAVHAVGEEDGVPYFAMELVRGRTVEELLRRLAGRDPQSLRGRDLDPSGGGEGYLFEGSWEDACLRVVRQVCQALEFAHKNGVLHRDIKPSNVMITEEGAPRALLLDFGLATGAAGAQRLTRTGAQIGSLRYMSSEQVRGDSAAIGPRTDVYGLGLLLYEMCSNGPAFAGRSDVELMLAIERGALPPLRTRNHTLSWEVETICATATDREPSRRYASVSDLARDLANALERRPIEARRPGAALRLRRWVQRRPAVATAALLGGLLVVGGPAGYAWQQARASRAMAAQLERTDRLADLALESMDRLQTRLASEDLRFLPQVEPVRRAALEDAVELAEKLAAERENDPRAARGVVRAKARLGVLLDSLGRRGESAEVLREVVERTKAMVAAAPDDDALRLELLGRRLDFAQALYISGGTEEAHPLLTELRSDLAQRRDVVSAKLLITSGTVLANLLRTTDRLTEARAMLAECAADADRLVEELSFDTDLGYAAYLAWNEYGLLLSTRYTSAEGELDPATLPALERAVELAQRLVEVLPAEPTYRASLAGARGNLGGAYQRSGQFEPALECYEAGRRELEPLVRDYPSTLPYKLELATQRNQLGIVYATQGWRSWKAGDEEAAHRFELLTEPHYRATVELLEEIVAAAPGEVLFVHRLAVARYNLAVIVARLDPESTAGDDLYAASLEAARRAYELSPDNSDILRTLMDAHKALYDQRRVAGEFEQAVDAMEEMTRDLPDLWQAHARAAMFIGIAAGQARAAGKEELVARFAERACPLLRRAILLGLPDPETIGDLKDSAPLHGTPAWEQLTADLPGLIAQREAAGTDGTPKD